MIWSAPGARISILRGNWCVFYEENGCFEVFLQRKMVFFFFFINSYISLNNPYFSNFSPLKMLQMTPKCHFSHLRTLIPTISQVRGAYLYRENERAAELSQPSPILPNIEATHESYNWCLDTVLCNINRSEIVIATHNQQSVEFAVNRCVFSGF
jgi:hypothetical protein